MDANHEGELFSTILPMVRKSCQEHMMKDRVAATRLALWHAREARRLGNCPSNPSRPWYRCCNGAIAFGG